MSCRDGDAHQSEVMIGGLPCSYYSASSRSLIADSEGAVLLGSYRLGIPTHHRDLTTFQLESRVSSSDSSAFSPTGGMLPAVPLLLLV